MDPERAKYLRIIERRFLELRGRGLMLSPRDVMLVESWRQREIPTRVILGALEDGARRFWDGRPHGTPLPASLAYFAPHIDDATRQRQQLLVEGGSSPRGQTSQPQTTRQAARDALLACVEASGRRQEVESARQVLRKAWRRLAQASSDEAWWELVMDVDGELVQSLEATLDEDQRLVLEDAIEQAIQRAGGAAMGDEGRRDVGEAERERWVRDHFQIRDLMEVLIERTM